VSRVLTVKLAFLHNASTLTPKVQSQIYSKLGMLCDDPSPDAKAKKLLKGQSGLYRLRSGDFRIFYTYDDTHVSVLKLSRRDDDTYDHMAAPEHLGTPDPFEPEDSGQVWDRWIPSPGKNASAHERTLPIKLTEEVLEALGVPEAYWPKLTTLETEEALLGEESVPDELRLTIHEAVVEKPLSEVLRQPDFVAEPSELLKFKPGELIPFLLKLNPEQQEVVAWGVNAKGPTLLKGGPGTGKSTVALYRARAMVRAFAKRAEKPRVLFTTYTNALANYSRPLLDKLLSEEAGTVEVKTADSLVMQLARPRLGKNTHIASGPDLKAALDAVLKALRTKGLSGNRLEQRSKQATLDKLGADYLLDELLGVIIARGIDSLDVYLAAPRPGRLKRLKKLGRSAIWEVHEAFVQELERRGLVSWEQIRWLAVEAAESGEAKLPRYDGVIVDEVQDLNPSVIRLLAGLAKHPGGLFFTADADQSIYGGSFRWKDIHDSLSFQGRSAHLKASHRTTQEIGEAARQYLKDGAIEEPGRTTYVHRGPSPAVRAVKSRDDEADLLAAFIKQATRQFHLPLNAAAVLVPTSGAGGQVASRLTEREVPATFMTSQNLELGQTGVKVLPLVAAKGLEFPVVAIAGFLDGRFPYNHPDWTPEAVAEAMQRARRTMFVGMTRAMRALLVIVPHTPPNDVLTGFDPSLWNTGKEDAA